MPDITDVAASLAPAAPTPASQFVPEEMKRRQMMYQMLAQQAGSAASPIYNTGTGLAKIAEGALAGFLMHSDNEENKQANAANSTLLAKYLAGGTSSPAAQATLADSPPSDPQGAPPAMPTPQGAPVSPAAPVADTSGKIYKNDEPSPLDPPSGQDRDNAIRTIAAEESDPNGMLGVANVIRNRAVDGGYGGDTPTAVVQSKNQFEPWNTPAGRAKMVAIDPKSPQYLAAALALDKAYGVNGNAPNDPTEGKLMFYAPGAQAALGRPAPSWAQGQEGQKLGNTMFYDDNSETPANATAVQGGPLPNVTPQAAATAAALAPAAAPNANQQQKALAMQLMLDERTPPAVKQFLLQQNDPARNLDLQLKQAQIANLPLLAEHQKLENAKAKQDLDNPDKTLETGTDPLTGKKTFAQYDRASGTWKPISMAQGTQPDAPAPNADLHGTEFIDSVKKTNPQIASQVQAIVEGRAPYPTGMLLKTPYGQQLAAMVTQADPSFETGNAISRVKVRNDFNNGTSPNSAAVAITAGNTALRHLGHLSDTADKLNNGNYPWLNSVENYASTATGGGLPVIDFKNAVSKYVEEATKFYRGTGGTESDIQRDLGNLDPNMSPAQLRMAIKTQADLMHSKVNALQDRWRNGMGPLVPDFPILNDEAKAAMDRINNRASADTPNAQAAVPQAVPDPAAIAEAKRRGLIK